MALTNGSWDSWSLYVAVVDSGLWPVVLQLLQFYWLHSTVDMDSTSAHAQELSYKSTWHCSSSGNLIFMIIHPKRAIGVNGWVLNHVKSALQSYQPQMTDFVRKTSIMYLFLSTLNTFAQRLTWVWVCESACKECEVPYSRCTQETCTPTWHTQAHTDISYEEGEALDSLAWSRWYFSTCKDSSSACD